ncbi:MAG: hypothetical protein SVP26_03525 [Chloroflexota bacterium]|nr:hypothetical protein [Chloroflexota bacterium]
MLTAAMVIGVLGGVAYLMAGLVAAVLGVPAGDTWSSVALVGAPVWLVMLIPIGLMGIIGGALGRRRPTEAGILLWLASGALVVVGLVSVHDMLRLIGDSPLSLHGYESVIVFALVLYFVAGLFALMGGGTLALVGRTAKITAKANGRVTRAGRRV